MNSFEIKALVFLAINKNIEKANAEEIIEFSDAIAKYPLTKVEIENATNFLAKINLIERINNKFIATKKGKELFANVEKNNKSHFTVLEKLVESLKNNA